MGKIIPHKKKSPMFPNLGEENDTQLILNDFKKLLPTVPLAQRAKALAMYNIMKNYVISDEASDKLCDANMADFSNAELEITGKADGIIEGGKPCSDDQLQAVKEFLNEDESVTPEANDGKPMDGYWLTCFKNKKIEVAECDEPLLKHLYKLDVVENNDKPEETVEVTPEAKADTEPKPETEIKSEDPNAPSKFEEPKKAEKKKTLDVKFYFMTNEWFENEVLSLQIHYSGEEPVKSVSDKVVWKSGKNITEKKISKKQKSKKTGKTRTVDKVVKTESFFNIFGDFTAEEFEMPDAEAEEAPEMNLYMVSGTIDEILEMAPYSLEYYLDVHPEEDEDDSEGEDDDEDDEDDESDDDDKKPKKKYQKNTGKGCCKPPPKKKESAASGDKDKDGGAPKEQECKQN